MILAQPPAIRLLARENPPHRSFRSVLPISRIPAGQENFAPGQNCCRSSWKVEGFFSHRLTPMDTNFEEEHPRIRVSFVAMESAPMIRRTARKLPLLVLVAAPGGATLRRQSCRPGGGSAGRKPATATVHQETLPACTERGARKASRPTHRSRADLTSRPIRERWNRIGSRNLWPRT